MVTIRVSVHKEHVNVTIAFLDHSTTNPTMPTGGLEPEIRPIADVDPQLPTSTVSDFGQKRRTPGRTPS